MYNKALVEDNNKTVRNGLRDCEKAKDQHEKESYPLLLAASVLCRFPHIAFVHILIFALLSIPYVQADLYC